MAKTIEAKWSNDRIETMHRLLNDAGYVACWGCKPFDSAKIECYTGPQGAIMVQFIWQHKNVSVEIYHTGGVPVEWATIGEWLKQTPLEARHA